MQSEVQRRILESERMLKALPPAARQHKVCTFFSLIVGELLISDLLVTGGQHESIEMPLLSSAHYASVSVLILTFGGKKASKLHSHTDGSKLC